MNSKKLFKDIGFAFVSQSLNIVVNVLVSLLLPKLLGVREFGYWQLFIFYFGYLGFFHLGINDGIYLINGGLTRSKIDKRSINSQFVFSISYQMLISVAVLLIAFFGPFEADRRFVIATIASLLVINNSALFLGYAFQAMNETALFSMSAAIDSLSFFFALFTLLVFGVDSFKPYVVFYTVAKTLRLAFCLNKARDFFSSGLHPLRQTVGESIASIRVGIKLMIANIASTLILGTVRFFVDLKWGIEVFSIVSFSLSITTFFLMFLSQVSMVLFPNLKQLDHKRLAVMFPVIRDGLDLLLPLVYVFYGPVVIILTLWIPDYAQSIRLFSLLFPICVFDGKMDIVGATFFKVLRKEKNLLTLNIITCVSSVLATLFGTYILNSVELVLFLVVIILGARSAISEYLISKELNVDSSVLGLAAIVVSTIFIVVAQHFPAGVSSLTYLFVYLCYLFVFRKRIRQLIESFPSKASTR